MNDDKSPIDIGKIEKESEINNCTEGILPIAETLMSAVGLREPMRIFSTLTNYCIAKRRDEIVLMIAGVVNELSVRMDELSFNKLPENEEFITEIMYVIQIAMRTKQKEKLEALKNALLNSALENTPDEDLRLILLNLIDTLTTLHLQLLKFFSEPKSPKFVEELKTDIKQIGNEHKGVYYLIFDLFDVLEYQYPELNGKRDIYVHVLKDLNSRELLIYNTEFKIEPNGNIEPVILPMGEMLLSFINSPEI